MSCFQIFFLILIPLTSSRGSDDRNDISYCAEDGLTDNKCVGTVTSYDESGNVNQYINYISMCKSKTDYCQTVTYANRDIGFCAKIIHQGRPGNKCKEPGDCYSGICEDKKCVGKEDNQYCESSLECKMNSACVYQDLSSDRTSTTRTCVPLVSSGEECKFGSTSVQRRNTYYTPMFNFINEREDVIFQPLLELRDLS